MTHKATVRVAKIDYGGKVGQAYFATVDGVRIFFPTSITEVEELENFVDLHVDAWYAKKNDLEVIAEWET